MNDYLQPCAGLTGSDATRPFSSPFTIPIPVLVSWKMNQGTEKSFAFKTIQSKEQAVQSALERLSVKRIPMILHDDEPMQGIEFSYSFSFGRATATNRDDVLISLIPRASMTKPNIQTSIDLDVSLYENSPPGEFAGRVAGMALSAADSVYSADLNHALFFSTLAEDREVEISIVGFHRGATQQDPLRGFDTNSINECLQLFLDSPKEKILVKATTRDLAEHTGVLAALFHASQTEAAKETFDHTTGKWIFENFGKGVDGTQFVRGVHEASDALFRVGTAARLVRLRKRQVEVFVVSAEDNEQVFRDGFRLHIVPDESAVVILVPSDVQFDLNRHICLGLASMLGGVPLEVVKSAAEIEASEASISLLLPSHVRHRALRGIVLYELYRLLQTVKHRAVTSNVTEVAMNDFVNDLYLAQTAISKNDWIEARRLIRSTHEFVRELAKMANLAREKKQACLQRGGGARRRHHRFGWDFHRKRSVFYVLGLVFFASLVWLGLHVCRFGGRATRASSSALFGRLHVD